MGGAGGGAGLGPGAAGETAAGAAPDNGHERDSAGLPAGRCAPGPPGFRAGAHAGHATYAGIVQDALDVEGKPVFAGTGQRVMVQAADHDGRPIIGPKSYLSARPWDAPAARSGAGGGAATSAARLAQWYPDTPGVKSSRVVAAVLGREGGEGRCLFRGRRRRGPQGGGPDAVNTG